MAYSKRWYIQRSFAEVGFAEYAFDLEPEQLQEALERLDSMMATWDGIGIRVGWSIPNSEDESALDDEVDVPAFAREAIFLQCGLRVAPMIGKTPSADTKVNAKNAYDALTRQMAQPIPMQFPDTLPSGAGNKPWRTVDNPFLGPPANPVLAGGEGPIDLGTLPSENVNPESP